MLSLDDHGLIISPLAVVCKLLQLLLESSCLFQRLLQLGVRYDLISALHDPGCLASLSV